MSSEGQIGFYPSFIEALICLWTSQDDSSFWGRGRVRIQDRCHLALLGTPLLLCLSHPFSFLILVKDLVVAVDYPMLLTCRLNSFVKYSGTIRAEKGIQ